MGADGKELNDDQISKRKLAFKNMMNYTRNLVIDKRIKKDEDVIYKINY